MRRQDKIQVHKSRIQLNEHKFQVESERGWAGQHGQHPETEEEENYRPAPRSKNLEEEKD